jgi:hypothetical protein
MAEDVTRRFRADSSVPYVQAFVGVLEYARTHPDADFSVLVGQFDGNVRAFIHNGFTVSGPEAVVEALTDVIEREGLIAVDA